MTTINKKQADPIDLAHAERLRRCAELGQVAPIDKPRTREHYEQMLAQLQAE
jgi:hypothetical protein